MTLNEFKVIYYKNMELAKKLFTETNTFHSVCPFSNHDSSLSKTIGKKMESSVIILR